MLATLKLEQKKTLEIGLLLVPTLLTIEASDQISYQKLQDVQ